MKAEEAQTWGTLGDTVNFGGKEPTKDLRRVPRNIQQMC